MKIYEIYSWPKDKQIKRYFFTNIEAANKFVEHLNKVESDYPHKISELTVYDQCDDYIDSILLASKDNESLIVYTDSKANEIVTQKLENKSKEK